MKEEGFPLSGLTFADAPDINEEHLNEKLKAITEKCQAVLAHNSKLQEQVSKCQ